MSGGNPNRSGGAGGPPASAPGSEIKGRGRYQVYGSFRGTDQGAAEPYLIAPKAEFNKEIAVVVVNLYSGKASAPDKTTFDNADFKLAWLLRNDPLANLSTVPADKVDDVKVAVTIKNANCWKAAPAARQALRASFEVFCQWVETLELGAQAIVPGGAAVLINRVAEALPAPLGDSLFFHAGFNAGRGASSSPYVDLRPGMRLRVDFAANQFVAPGSPLNGLVGSGQSHYYIGRDSDQRIVFDAFLAAIAAPETSAPLGQATASGALDLQAAGAARRHYRLFYPTQLPPATAPGDGRLTRNVTLIGADTRADLKAATDVYSQSGDLAAAAGLPIIALSFRGRAVAVPEIAVYINREVGNHRDSALTYVPLGTTLRQLLDQQAGAWNSRQLYDEDGTIRLRRFWAEEDGVPQYRRVMLNPVRAADIRVFDLPLTRSDMLDITFDMDA